jgi:translation initiation factor eIF-2B subunit delta
VTKVLLGAFNMLSNGSMTSRAGAALVALTANEFRVPVIVRASLSVCLSLSLAVA